MQMPYGGGGGGGPPGPGYHMAQQNMYPPVQYGRGYPQQPQQGYGTPPQGTAKRLRILHGRCMMV